MIGQPIPPEREAWERDQIAAMRRRMVFWHLFRRMATRAAIMAVVIAAFVLAVYFLS
jgi:hypothetical protein